MSLTHQDIPALKADRHVEIIELVNAGSCFTASVVRELLDEIKRLRLNSAKEIDKTRQLKVLLKQGTILMPLGTAKRAAWITAVAKEVE
jgi:hypothetical protein